MKPLLDLFGGKVFCPNCFTYVKPRYEKSSATITYCSICLLLLRDACNRRQYTKGLKWCSGCQDFRGSWHKKYGWCSECHTKLRQHSYTRVAKQRREKLIKRY